MGTRHLISVVVDGTTKIAQYGQWDGYPEGQGTAIATFLQAVNLDKFTDAVRQTRFMTDDEHKAITSKFSSDGWMTMEESDNFELRYPELHRNTGSDILSLVLFAGKRNLVDNSDFVDDTLFCEFAYVINLDDKTVKVIWGYPDRQDVVYAIEDFTPEAMEQLSAFIASEEE